MDVTGQLNAARATLHDTIHENLLGRVSTMLQISLPPCCKCTVFEYLRELQRIQVWPLNDCLRHQGIDELIDRLAHFEAARMHTYIESSADQPADCLVCTTDWNGVVRCAASRVASFFEGLCLDCVFRTADKDHLRDDQHYDKKDYWISLESGDRFDRGCRIQHGEPTWYFSSMEQQSQRQGPGAYSGALPYRLLNRG